MIHVFQMESKDAVTLEKGWDLINSAFICKLEDALEADFDHTNPPKRIFSITEQTNHYTLVYDLCTKATGSYEEILYHRYRETINSYLRRKVKPTLDTGTEPLIRKMAIAWIKFKTFNRVLKGIFSYLDRFYVELHGLLTLEELATSQFKKLFMEYRLEFAKSIVDKYDQLREAADQTEQTNGQIGEDSLKTGDLKISLQIYDSVDPERAAFKADVEKTVLDRTHAYYDKTSQIWIIECSLEDYLIIFNETLSEELSRCKMIFDDKLAELVREVMVNSMLKNKLSSIKNKLFEHKNITLLDNGLVYYTLSMLPEGLELIGDYLAKQIQNEGEVIDLKASSGDIINAVLDLFNRFGKIVKNCYRADKFIQKSFNQGIEWLLNDKIGTCESARYISQYINEKIILNDNIENPMLLFPHLSNKRAFIEHYRHLLANRLLKNSSLDTEFSAYQLLTKMASSRSTVKLQGMIEDVNYSNSTTNVAEIDGVEFKAYYLTSDYWVDFENIKNPIETPNIYPQLNKHIANLERRYLSNFKHRTLRWVHQLGHTVLTSDKLEIECNLIQATIILHYMDKVTKISDIASLMNVQNQFVLDCISNMNKKIEIFAIDDCDNLSFNHLTGKINLALDYVEISNVATNKVDDNSMSIDAAIIRSLKTSKALRLAQLLANVQTNLGPLFPEAVKERIDLMVSSGQINYTPPDLYNYL